jgi:type II secretory pathway pseudopilin PulG
VAGGAILGVVVLIVVGLALAVGGGGSSSGPDRAAYRSAATKAAKDFEAASKIAGAHLRTAQNPLDFSAGADEFRRAVSVFIARLQGLTPPAAARAPQARLISLLRRFTGDVSAISDAVNAGDRQRVLNLAGPIQRDQAEVKAAAADLQKAVGG